MEIRTNLLRTLVFIEQNLSEDLRLEIVARHAGLSPAHFHRVFGGAVGETFQKYVERLRLEKSRRLLRITEFSILEIALECGYNSHENFTRHFKKRYGESPRDIRRRMLFNAGNSEQGAPSQKKEPGQDTGETSEHHHTRPRTVRLRELHLAFIRLRGDYYNLPPVDPETPGVWRTLRDAVPGAGIYMGICHDDPAVTPLEKIRYDACVQTRSDFSPEKVKAGKNNSESNDNSSESLGYRRIEAGYFACITHLGDSGTIHLAYAALGEYAAGLVNFTFVEEPPFEIYLEYTARDIARTEIYFRLRKT